MGLWGSLPKLLFLPCTPIFCPCNPGPDIALSLGLKIPGQETLSVGALFRTRRNTLCHRDFIMDEGLAMNKYFSWVVSTLECVWEINCGFLTGLIWSLPLLLEKLRCMSRYCSRRAAGCIGFRAVSAVSLVSIAVSSTDEASAEALLGSCHIHCLSPPWVSAGLSPRAPQLFLNFHLSPDHPTPTKEKGSRGGEAGS